MSRVLFLKALSLAVMTVTLISCDKDFNTIGSGIVGEDNFEINKMEFDALNAGYEFTGAVQTNNLPLNSLGVFKNPAFGTAKSHFVSQVELNAAAPEIGDNPQIDSVWVYVPYFSHVNRDNPMESDEVHRNYDLDSIYGGGTKFKLKVYENGYYLGNYDPQDPSGVLRHYSNERLTKVDPYKIGTNSNGDVVFNGEPLNNGAAEENDEFYFSDKEHIFFKRNQDGEFLSSSGEVLSPSATIKERVVVERFAPGMWINLNKEFIKKRILLASSDKLLNNSAFKEYFRGLYFEVEPNGTGEGALAMLDFSKGYIRVEYSYEETSGTPATTVTKRRMLRFNLKGNTVNFFDNDYNLPVGDTNRLVLMGGGKGATGNGDGSVAYIDVFGTADNDSNGIPDKLDEIRQQGWLINEANLVFYVDQAKMGATGQEEPNRLYLYDSKNRSPLIDQSMDMTTSALTPKFSKYVYGGILEKESGKGLKYKFRITEYVKSCIKNDSTNFRLRLGVTENVFITSNAKLKNPIGNPETNFIPLSSVINPLGTVLYGINIPSTDSNYDKRLKLEIYYTKPD